MTMQIATEPLRPVRRFRPSSQPARARIPELDGLRGAAILSVMCFHYFEAFTGQQHSPLAYFHPLIAMGWTGVDLFFVLSGFLIGGVLLDARSSSSYFKTFYIRRFYRIIPVYYAWICSFFVLITIAGISTSRAEVVVWPHHPPIYVYLLFLQNMRGIHYAGVSAAWLAVTWSLAVEEQFYLVTPLLVRLLSTRALVAVLSATIVVAPFIRFFVHMEWSSGPELASKLMPCRADAFAIGMLVAVLWRSNYLRARLAASKRKVYLLLCISFAGLLMATMRWSSAPNSVGLHTVGYTITAFSFAAILLFVLMKPVSPIASLFRMGWLREIGAVSYCMYLIHVVIWAGCHDLLPLTVRQSASWRNAGLSLVAGALTFGIARMSWRCFERPLLQRGHAYRY
jgi:peptidoglycan/LPS O-acetylase OafA/YrhL